MDDAQWIWAAVALGSGILFGEIAGRLLRKRLARSGGSGAAVNASALGSFVFWASTAVGLVIATAAIDVEVLRDLGDRVGDNLPRLLSAFLLLIVGYAVAVAVAATVGQSARKATGVRQVALERALRVLILAAAVVIALTEVGVESSMLVVLVAVVIGAPALAIALLSAHGGRDVAAQLASGRSLRHRIRPGDRLAAGDVDGVVIALHPTAVEVEDDDGRRVMVPNATLLERPFTLGDPGQ